jgi:DNA-binding MarR family transcriptional regulator
MSDQLKLSNQVCFPIYTLAKEVINHYRPILKELGITYPQYLVMLVLWEEDELNVTEIGWKLTLDSGTLTPLLKRLEQKQLIKRKRVASDERIVKISLTKKGNEMKENAEKVPHQMIKSMNISADHLETLKSSIENIISHLPKKKA